jgi:hypothetical protein
MKKIYNDGNYVIIDDGLNIYEYTKNSFYSKRSGNYIIKDNNLGLEYTILTSDIPNWYDKDGLVAYTESTLLTFLKSYTGFNTALGSSKAIAQTLLLNDAITNITTANVEQDVNLTGSTQELQNFTFNGTNTFTYTGASGARITFIGNASEQDTTLITGGALVTVTMVLRYNGTLIIETPVTYDKNLAIKDFSANRTFLNVQNGDTFKLQIKADRADSIKISELYTQLIEL